MTTDDLLKLARFRILDARNCNEAARIRLLGQMADEIERLQRPQMALKRIPYEEIAEFLKDDPSAMGTVAALCEWEPK
jgi:hypothetical protein